MTALGAAFKGQYSLASCVIGPHPSQQLPWVPLGNLTAIQSAPSLLLQSPGVGDYWGTCSLALLAAQGICATAKVRRSGV